MDIGVGARGGAELVDQIAEAVKHARVATCGGRHAGGSQLAGELFTGCALRVSAGAGAEAWELFDSWQGVDTHAPTRHVRLGQQVVHAYEGEDAARHVREIIAESPE